MRRSVAVLACVSALMLFPNLALSQACSALCQENPGGLFLTAAWVQSLKTNVFMTESGNTFLERTGEWAYSYNAFQLGFGAPLALPDERRFGTLILGGTIALPSSGEAQESFTTGAVTLHKRKWAANTSYATLEGIWACPAYKAWRLLGGFRWVNWQTRYERPFDSLPLGASLPTDTADLTLNAYLPLVGLSTTARGVRVGVLGFPTTTGTLEHKESFTGAISRIEIRGKLHAGYFAEAFVEYDAPSFDLPGLSGGLSVFAKASALRSTANTQLEQALTGISDDYRFTVQRTLFFLGVKAKFEFQLGALLGL